MDAVNRDAGGLTPIPDRLIPRSQGRFLPGAQLEAHIDGRRTRAPTIRGRDRGQSAPAAQDLTTLL